MAALIDPPIFITTRDRVTQLRVLVEWLERAGHERITFIDNASTYEPLLEYLHATPHSVLSLGANRGARVAWEGDLVPVDEAYVVTDPDLIPLEECPMDAVEHLAELLERHQDLHKAGLGLYLEDVPADLPCLGWERQLVEPAKEREPGVYTSMIDTTFALHRAGTGFTFEALRCGFPYQVRHMPWYVRPEEADPELAYYLEHALRGDGGTTSWTV